MLKWSLGKWHTMNYRGWLWLAANVCMPYGCRMQSCVIVTNVMCLQQARDPIYSRSRGCGVDPRNLAQRIMDVSLSYTCLCTPVCDVWQPKLQPEMVCGVQCIFSIIFACGACAAVSPIHVYRWKVLVVACLQIRSQIAKEMTQDLKDVSQENTGLLRETLTISFSLDNIVAHPIDPTS